MEITALSVDSVATVASDPYCHLLMFYTTHLFLSVSFHPV